MNVLKVWIGDGPRMCCSRGGLVLSIGHAADDAQLLGDAHGKWQSDAVVYNGWQILVQMCCREGEGVDCLFGELEKTWDAWDIGHVQLH